MCGVFFAYYVYLVLLCEQVSVAKKSYGHKSDPKVILLTVSVPLFGTCFYFSFGHL